MSNKALCIGFNNYPGTHMDLSGCVNDANDWTQTFKRAALALGPCWTPRPPSPI